MTIKEAVEKVKTKFNEDRKTYGVDEYYNNGYMQALDDILKEVGKEVDKDEIIKHLESQVAQLSQDYGKKDEELTWSDINNGKLRDEISELKTEIKILNTPKPIESDTQDNIIVSQKFEEETKNLNENKVTVGINKDEVIRDLEAERHRLKCENKDLVENIEELEAYLEQERLDKYILSEKWKVVEMFMK